jgi:hypothetical protein
VRRNQVAGAAGIRTNAGRVATANENADNIIDIYTLQLPMNNSTAQNRPQRPLGIMGVATEETARLEPLSSSDYPPQESGVVRLLKTGRTHAGFRRNEIGSVIRDRSRPVVLEGQLRRQLINPRAECKILFV